MRNLGTSGNANKHDGKHGSQSVPWQQKVCNTDPHCEVRLLDFKESNAIAAGKVWIKKVSLNEESLISGGIFKYLSKTLPVQT